MENYKFYFIANLHSSIKTLYESRKKIELFLQMEQFIITKQEELKKKDKVQDFKIPYESIKNFLETKQQSYEDDEKHLIQEIQKAI